MRMIRDLNADAHNLVERVMKREKAVKGAIIEAADDLDDAEHKR